MTPSEPIWLYLDYLTGSNRRLCNPKIVILQLKGIECKHCNYYWQL